MFTFGHIGVVWCVSQAIWTEGRTTKVVTTALRIARALGTVTLKTVTNNELFE